jgi:hypothetical protein
VSRSGSLLQLLSSCIQYGYQNENRVAVQAYSISVPAVMAMPHSGTLLAQMLMRTAAVTHLAGGMLEPAFCEWWSARARFPLLAPEHSAQLGPSLYSVTVLPIHESHLEHNLTLLLLLLQVKELENTIVTNFRGLANTNFSPTPVHLLSLTTTLAQACGSTRLVIKSSAFTINAVRSPKLWPVIYLWPVPFRHRSV